VHDNPDVALCDAAQALTLDEYGEMLRQLRAIHEVIT
jgi:3-deoxy-D-arabino-heptulosonate 7-phosphate (DAHP) synthase